MNHMLYNSFNAPWNDPQEPITPRCPVCGSTDLKIIKGAAGCYFCNYIDELHKFTER